MRIDTIHYSRKCSDGNYGNLELGMHAQLEDTDDPQNAAANLRAQVDGLLAQTAKNAGLVESIEQQVYELERRLTQKERDLERMAGQWTLAKAFLEQHGVDTSRYHDNPF